MTMTTVNREIPQIYKTLNDICIVANEIVQERGITYNFICPVCGGPAHIERDLISDHLLAWCEDCDSRATK
jgi:hypothetical protein